MNKRQYDLYGSTRSDLRQLCSDVEVALDMKFQSHESDYLGGDYFMAGDLRGEHLEIKRNRIDSGDQEEFVEPKFAEYPVLLEVNATMRGDELRTRLLAVDGLNFLRRSET